MQIDLASMLNKAISFARASIDDIPDSASVDQEADIIAAVSETPDRLADMILSSSDDPEARAKAKDWLDGVRA